MKRYLLAKVMVKVDGFEQEMKVMVAGMDYDALQGKDVPGLWAMGRRLLYDNLINMVSIWSRKAEFSGQREITQIQRVMMETPGSRVVRRRWMHQGRTDPGRGC